MVDESQREDVARAMRELNEAWLAGRVEDIEPMVHPDITMVVPGFTARVQGREQLLAGFRDFCQNATVHEFREHDHQVDVAGRTAVITYRYEMIYERSGQRSRATGRDLWVFEKPDREWIAVWRAMLDMEDNAV
jgi:hypothetical protein